MKVKPLYDRVVVRKIDEEITSGGIVIPKSAQGGDVLKAVVLAVGDGYRGDTRIVSPLRVQVNDIVHLSK